MYGIEDAKSEPLNADLLYDLERYVLRVACKVLMLNPCIVIAESRNTPNLDALMVDRDHNRA